MLGLAATALAGSTVIVGAVDARPFSSASKTKYAEVDFSWSAEAGAVPALLRQLRTQLTREQSKTASCGKAESEARISTGGQAIACTSSTKVTTSGQTARLLSLSRAYWAFTGGAHGSGATTALLWDRKQGREIKFGSLFQRPDGYAPVLRTTYCRALNAERKKRRGDDYQSSSITEFDSCPPFADLALIPSDKRRLRRFDAIHVIAAPYTAGSFAEGEYDIAVPVTPKLIAAMKPEFRASFAP